MVKGYVVNNTGRSRHIFKRAVYSAQKVSLDDVERVLGSKVPEGTSFTEWLEQYLPSGWALAVAECTVAVDARHYRETHTAVLVGVDDRV